MFGPYSKDEIAILPRKIAGILDVEAKCSNFAKLINVVNDYSYVTEYTYSVDNRILGMLLFVC